MARTVQDIPVYGRSPADVRNEILAWMSASGGWVLEERPDFIKIQMGAGIASAARIVEVYFRSDQTATWVHTEGYVKGLGQEMDFSPSAISAGIPRKDGWNRINDLWARLSRLSVQAPAPAPEPSMPPPPPTTGSAGFCSQCGTTLRDGAQFCHSCGSSAS